MTPPPYDNGRGDVSNAVRSQAAVAEPVAIVGMACRFPGADDPAAFWQLLADGRDTSREAPADITDKARMRISTQPGDWGRHTVTNCEPAGLNAP